MRHFLPQNARYLVWKYRGKKQKLWKNLEKKYGEPVLEEHEWGDEEEGDGSAQNEEHEDLDKEDAETDREEQDL